MAIVTFDRKEIEKHFTLDTKTIHKINLFGTPIEKVDDTVLELEILANRPDLLSLQGFVRAFKAFLGKEPGLKNYKVKDTSQKLLLEKSLPSQWPYALACIVRNIEFNDARIKEVIDIQEKLGATMLRKRKKGGLGLYPLEKINFPVTFKGMHPDKIKFQPLEFDREITGRQILSQHPTGRAYAPICESFERFPVFVDASGKIMSMPPIINSHTIGKIDHTTKDVFIECTGPDLKTLHKALTILVTALAEMGGKIESLECIQHNGQKVIAPALAIQKMKFSLENANRRLGLKLTESQAQKLFPLMGLEYEKGVVKVPAWRSDIIGEVDLIEDLAIAYGYDNLIPSKHESATLAATNSQTAKVEKITSLLIGLGLLETSSYHLIKESEAKSLKVTNKIEVENSKTEYKLLRPNLLIPALRILAENKDAEYPQYIFEIGNVFNRALSETAVQESLHLLIALSPANFTECKQILDYLVRMLSTSYTLQRSSKQGLIEGRSAQITSNNKVLGYLGEVHPETLQAFGIKMPLAVLELNLDLL